MHHHHSYPDEGTDDKSGTWQLFSVWSLRKEQRKKENQEKENLKDIFFKKERNENDFIYILSLIKKYDVINACYLKAQHYINLASNSLSIFKESEEKNILENLTSFSLARNF